jgi:hypothetical protein
MEKMRKCSRCGTEMMECGHITGAGFKLNDRDFRTYPIKTAICPKCHEVSLYLEEQDFDKMIGKALIERKI